MSDGHHGRSGRLNDGLFTSASEEWATPPAFFELLDQLFGPFALDAAATDENAKCARYFTKAQDGLGRSWGARGTTVFLNPPYGRDIGMWVQKAREESYLGPTVVCLLPARMDAKWWQDNVMRAVEVFCVSGRLSFVSSGGSLGPAPFPSAVVVFRRERPGPPAFSAMGRNLIEHVRFS